MASSIRSHTRDFCIKNSLLLATKAQQRSFFAPGGEQQTLEYKCSYDLDHEHNITFLDGAKAFVPNDIYPEFMISVGLDYNNATRYSFDRRPFSSACELPPKDVKACRRLVFDLDIITLNGVSPVTKLAIYHCVAVAIKMFFSENTELINNFIMIVCESSEVKKSYKGKLGKKNGIHISVPKVIVNLEQCLTIRLTVIHLLEQYFEKHSNLFLNTLDDIVDRSIYTNGLRLPGACKVITCPVERKNHVNCGSCGGQLKMRVANPYKFSCLLNNTGEIIQEGASASDTNSTIINAFREHNVCQMLWSCAMNVEPDVRFTPGFSFYKHCPRVDPRFNKQVKRSKKGIFATDVDAHRQLTKSHHRTDRQIIVPFGHSLYRRVLPMIRGCHPCYETVQVDTIRVTSTKRTPTLFISIRGIGAKCCFRKAAHLALEAKKKPHELKFIDPIEHTTNRASFKFTGGVLYAHCYNRGYCKTLDDPNKYNYKHVLGNNSDIGNEELRNIYKAGTAGVSSPTASSSKPMNAETKKIHEGNMRTEGEQIEALLEAHNPRALPDITAEQIIAKRLAKRKKTGKKRPIYGKAFKTFSHSFKKRRTTA